jgi:hypothetical protein
MRESEMVQITLTRGLIIAVVAVTVDEILFEFLGRRVVSERLGDTLGEEVLAELLEAQKGPPTIGPRLRVVGGRES